MSTWDDKPNDYEHAMQEIERLRAERDALLAALKALVAEIKAGIDLEPDDNSVRNADAAIKQAEGESNIALGSAAMASVIKGTDNVTIGPPKAKQAEGK